MEDIDDIDMEYDIGMEEARDPKDYIVLTGINQTNNITEISREDLQEQFMNAVDLIEELDEMIGEVSDNMLREGIRRWRYRL